MADQINFTSTAASNQLTFDSSNDTFTSVSFTGTVSVAPEGPEGPQGDPGEGVPAGGTTGQYLNKVDASDYNTQWSTLSKSSVGLGSVDNTSDASKPVSTATQTALDAKTNGAASSADNALARFDGTTGKAIQNSAATLSDAGALAITDSGVTATFRPSGGDVNIGAITDDAVNIVANNSTVSTFSGWEYGAQVLQQFWGDKTILLVNAPSGSPEEATIATALDYGSGNREWVDWTIEDYGGVDHKASINIAKQGTGTIVPFVIRTWDADAGTVAAVGKEYFTITPLSEVVINESSQDVNTRVEGNGDANLIFADAGTDRVGIGNAAPDEKLHVTGNIKASGTGAFGGDVTVPDEAYGVGWNGSLEVPTKNAVYDKIETIGGGSGITRSVTVTSGNFTAGATALTDYIYFVAGAHTPTMPTAVGNTNRYTIKNNHSAAITVQTTSSQTIDGTTTIDIAPEDSVDLISNNSNWSVI